MLLFHFVDSERWRGRFCRPGVVGQKSKPSSKTDGRENYAYWCTTRKASPETWAAATPKTVEQLLKLGFSVAVESGAGKLASFDDEAFAEAGAEIVTGDEVWQSDVILKVNAPNDDEIALLNPGTTLISFIWPAQNPQLMEKLAARNINVMAMDSVPRISRAQSLDALSSMANIAGYRAIVEAAHEFGRFFTGQITAAGKVPPAVVMVIGAGVAGLAAIGAANSLALLFAPSIPVRK